MPRTRKPAPLWTLTGRYVMQNLWSVVRCVFGIGQSVSLEKFLASEEGDSFLSCIIREDFQDISPFKNVGLFLDKFMTTYGDPDKLGKRLYPLYIMLLRPKSIELGVWMLSSRNSMALLQEWSFQHVQKLWIRDVKILETLLVPSVVQTFCNLEILSGKGSDRLLLEASKYCPRLKEIDLRCSDKNPVTDAGLVACSRLSQLTSISLTHESVTINGIQFLLDTAPKLQRVRTGKMSDIYALTEIYTRYASNKRSSRLPEYGLQELKEDNVLSRTSRSLGERLYKPLSCSVALCPHVTTVSLNKKVTDDELRALVNLNTLFCLKLYITYYTDVELTFAGGIVPVLQKHGKHLKSLTLGYLPDINVEAVAHLCSGLETFEFADCYLCSHWPAAVKKPDQPKTLSQLKKISIFCVENSDYAEHDPLQYWPSLMLSPYLEEVKIDWAQFFNDSIVDKILERNKFPNLKRLFMEQVDNISARSLWNFLYLDNNLEGIDYSCLNNEGLVTESEMVALEDYCMKFDLTFNFRWRY